jgi:hypothetical protein
MPRIHGTDPSTLASESSAEGLPHRVFKLSCQRAGCCALAAVLLLSAPVRADGLNATGVVGGLSIPTARELGNGTVAFGWGTVRESQLTGDVARNVSHVLGIGLAPGLDLVGRFTENATRDFSRSGGNLTSGISDLSANVKASIALSRSADAPRLALGVQDITRGAVNFKATYGVGTLPLGPLDISVGYGRSQGRMTPGTHRTLDGAFGGISYALVDSSVRGRLTVAAEHDGRQPLLGAQWLSSPVAVIGDGRVNVAAHRTLARGSGPGANVLTLGVTWPLAEAEKRRAQLEPAVLRPSDSPTMADLSPMARLAHLRQVLTAAGVERVRVGRRADGSWVIAYENRRFGHSEVDALGVVLGLAAEASGTDARKLWVFVMKFGQPVLTLSTDALAWRGYLRDGYPGVARGATRIEQGDGSVDSVDWLSDAGDGLSRPQVRVVPRLNSVFGTEFAAFDYALAVGAELGVPLWTGGIVAASWQKELVSSRNAKNGRPLETMRHPGGLRSLALHQIHWLGSRALVGAGLGWYARQAMGVEGQAVAFVPGREDLLLWKGRLLNRDLSEPFSSNVQHATAYRWVVQPTLWLEGGWQRREDGSSGPSLTISRWWGDIAIQVHYRKGRDDQLVGIGLSLPITPRLAPSTGRIQWLGASRWQHETGLRIGDGRTRREWIPNSSGDEWLLSWSVVDEMLDSGRATPGYVDGSLARLREAFHHLSLTRVTADGD